MSSKETNYTSPYELEGRVPLRHAILYGLQHVLAMFAGNLTPIILIRNDPIDQILKKSVLTSDEAGTLFLYLTIID